MVDRRLIEVSLPLAAISEQSTREKSTPEIRYDVVQMWARGAEYSDTYEA